MRNSGSKMLGNKKNLLAHIRLDVFRAQRKTIGFSFQDTHYKKLGF